MRFLVFLSPPKAVICMIVVKLSLSIIIIEPTQFSKISYICNIDSYYIISFSQVQHKQKVMFSGKSLGFFLTSQRGVSSISFLSRLLGGFLPKKRFLRKKIHIVAPIKMIVYNPMPIQKIY